MEQVQIPAFSDPLPVPIPLLKEKPRQGVPGKNPAPHPGHDLHNSTVAIGLRAALHLDAVRSRYTGKERDNETGNDYFEARYYSSAIGRFFSPDWSAKVEPVPYSKLDDPQTLNLYNYMQDNPLDGTDPTGHDRQAGTLINNGDPCQPSCSQMLGLPSFPHDLRFGIWDGPPTAQQQNGSSSGGGFWSRLGQHFGNLFHGHSWNYGMRFVVTSRILPAEPDPVVTTAADLAGVGAAISRNTPLGIASAVTSSVNDPSVPNVTLNAASVLIPMVIEGSDLPIAFGFAAYDGSKFAANTLTQVFTPDRLQSDTIDDGLGHTLQAPQAAFDADGGLSY